LKKKQKKFNFFNMATIKNIQAYEIIDSRGFPTIEGKLTLDDGRYVATSIPSGISVGKNEAVELRDQDANRFEGMGVLKPVAYINNLIAPKLVRVSPLKQVEVDNWLIKADGTKDKSRLGANTILTISQLFVKAGALISNQPIFQYINSLYEKMFKEKINLDRIPTPIFTLINGGSHSNNQLDFQEFQIIPSSANNFSTAYQKGVELFHQLKKILEFRNANISVGIEGGFTPNLATNLDGLDILIETINKKKLRLGIDIFLGLDIAANHFFENNYYHIKDRPQPLSSEKYLEFILKLLENYRIIILEDPVSEDDWKGWQKLNSQLSQETYLVGDDLLSSNKDLLTKAIKENVCNSLVIKPNQIGTITEVIEVFHLAKKNNFTAIISHRSGETTDDFVADLAVGLQADFVKFGAPSRGECVVKYNRLWQIEREELK
jgi:enolase